MYNLKKVKTIGKQAQGTNGEQYDNVTKQFLIANTGLFVISGMAERILTDLNNIISDVHSGRLEQGELEGMLMDVKVNVMDIKTSANETRERTKELNQ